MIMWQAADPQLWQGRIDVAEGPLAQRWHQQVQVFAAPGSRQPAGSVLLGFACDAGVARNHGRPGAAGGPSALRRALAAFAWHGQCPVYDGGDVLCPGGALEAAQAELAERVAAVLAAGHRPLIVGGGHELAWGSWQGLARHAVLHGQSRIGIVNFDAHFDLRAGAQGSSGTPFRQIAEDCATRQQPFHYACFGVARQANTAALYARAAALGVCWREDDQLAPWQLAEAQGALANFLAGLDAVHLSIDLDVLSAASAPGVSAPAARGVELAVLEALVDQVLASGKLLLAEIAELNPACDIDGRTARVAARLLSRLAR